MEVDEVVDLSCNTDKEDKEDMARTEATVRALTQNSGLTITPANMSNYNTSFGNSMHNEQNMSNRKCLVEFIYLKKKTFS